MLLRVSSQAIGEEAELEGAVGRATGDGGVPHGEAMVRFAEAATRGSEDLAASRSDLIAAIGPLPFVEVAATVGIFNGLVRVADGTGIPLDEGSRKISETFREDLGLVTFGSARNTDFDAPVSNHDPIGLPKLPGF